MRVHESASILLLPVLSTLGLVTCRLGSLDAFLTLTTANATIFVDRITQNLLLSRRTVPNIPS